jgi:hypothetical protein
VQVAMGRAAVSPAWTGRHRIVERYLHEPNNATPLDRGSTVAITRSRAARRGRAP